MIQNSYSNRVLLSFILDCLFLPKGLLEVFSIAYVLMKCYFLLNSSRAILNKVSLGVNNSRKNCMDLTCLTCSPEVSFVRIVWVVYEI